MKRIDFHIHTVATTQDEFFQFSLESLQKYIEIAQLSAIAITNHNFFDRDNYEYIIGNVDIEVFPGIEVDVEGTHILVISPKEEIDTFDLECNEVSINYKITEKGLDYDSFIKIFKNINKYLIIPHYKKKPEISTTLMEKLKDYIVCGEVSSAKKWYFCKKKSDLLTPVIFSDIRISDEIKIYPSTLTYLSCEQLTIPKIRVALKDKNKVHITKNQVDEEFQINSSGTTASIGLNIVMGLRSSGKTYTLENLLASFSKENVKYIKQFEIVNKANEKEFKDFIEKDNSKILETNISCFKNIIEIISQIDLVKDTSEIDEYLTSLKDFAEKSLNQDIYASSPLFNADPFEINEESNIDKLINALKLLLENESYIDLIESKLGIKNIRELLFDFIKIDSEMKLKNLTLSETNKTLKEIKEELDEKSALSSIKELDFNILAKNILHTKLFEDFVNKMKVETVIEDSEVLRFKINVTRRRFQNVEKIKKLIPRCPSISEAFRNSYDSPYKYIKKLQLAGISDSLLYKTLVDIDFNVVNIDDNTPISGGEKAEYVLYSELEDASKYDLVLIDEPESSFDNIFLKEKIIEKIKSLSQKTTVFIVTHNSTLGLLMQPDKILYTKKESPGNYNVYTGSLSTDNFSDVNGNTIGSYETLINIMEAGVDSYEEKGEVYESLKN